MDVSEAGRGGEGRRPQLWYGADCDGRRRCPPPPPASGALLFPSVPFRASPPLARRARGPPEAGAGGVGSRTVVTTKRGKGSRGGGGGSDHATAPSLRRAARQEREESALRAGCAPFPVPLGGGPAVHEGLAVVVGPGAPPTPPFGHCARFIMKALVAANVAHAGSRQRDGRGGREAPGNGSGWKIIAPVRLWRADGGYQFLPLRGHPPIPLPTVAAVGPSANAIPERQRREAKGGKCNRLSAVERRWRGR